MAESSIVPVMISLVSLLLIATGSAIVFKHIRIPYTIGLVLVGILLGWCAGDLDIFDFAGYIHLSPDFILYIILPTLVFESAIHIDSRQLLKNLLPVLILAAPGLIISTFIVGVLTAWWTPLPLAYAILFGALISATDPVAVIALFEDIGAPGRLKVLVDGESLFNDATAIVMFQIVAGVIAAGTFSATTRFSGALQFFWVFTGGIVAGIAVGLVIMLLIRLGRNDPLIDVAGTTIIAYAAYITADHWLHVSGVMAVVGAGLTVGWLGKNQFSRITGLYLKHFWDYAAFVANSLIFLLIGFTEDQLLRRIFTDPVIFIPILLAFIAITIARAPVVFGLIPFINRVSSVYRIDAKYQTVLFWGGLRGAVPTALALSLAKDYPYREGILSLTLGIVLCTLLIQGTTVRPLMRLLHIESGK